MLLLVDYGCWYNLAQPESKPQSFSELVDLVHDDEVENIDFEQEICRGRNPMLEAGFAQTDRSRW